MDDFTKRLTAKRREAMLAMSKEALVDRLDKLEDDWLTASHTQPSEIRLYMDGNAWCAVRAEGFTNIQECPAGFGSTPQEAVTVLLAEEDPHG